MVRWKHYPQNCSNPGLTWNYPTKIKFPLHLCVCGRGVHLQWGHLWSHRNEKTTKDYKEDLQDSPEADEELSAIVWPGGLAQEAPQEKFPSRTSKAKERTRFPRQVHSSRQRKSLQQIVWEETNAHAVHKEEKYRRAWVASAAFPAVKRVLFYLSARQELPFLVRGGLGTAVWSLEKI